LLRQLINCRKNAALLPHFCGILRILFLLAIFRKPPLAGAVNQRHL